MITAIVFNLMNMLGLYGVTECLPLKRKICTIGS